MEGSPVKQDRISRKAAQIMAKHPEIVCILFAIAFSFLSRYAKSLGNLAPQSVAQPPPQRFFPVSSPVADYYNGNIGDVGKRLGDVGTMFVMYYAPWCSRSMEARLEFERAARYLKGDVEFAAVNCWYPHSSCRQQNKFMSFPVMFFYHSRLDGFEYKGLLSAPYLIKFAEDLLQPITYLSSHEEMVMFMAHRDNAVIAYFDFNSSPQPPGFMQYYFASMRIREYVLRDTVDFGVITDRALAKKFEMRKSKTLFLVRALNDTLKYPMHRNYTATAIVQWINTLKQPAVIKWLLPANTKSIAVSSELEKGPAVILFTKDAPFTPIHHQITKLREVALTYRNCQNKTKIHDIVDTSTYLRWASIIYYLDLMQECQNMAKNVNKKDKGSEVKKEQVSAVPHCCVSVVTGESSGRNICDFCVNYSPNDPPLRSCDVHAISQLSGLRTLYYNSRDKPGCSVITPNYNPAQHITYCCDRYRRGSDVLTARFVNMGTFTGFDSPKYEQKYEVHPDESRDPFVIKGVSRELSKTCNQLRQQKLHRWGENIDVPNESFHSDNLPGKVLQGRECATNASLNFYAMDSKLNREFARNLGINLRDYSNGNAVVLYDNFNELQYVMRNEVTIENIVDFVDNYTMGTLPRSLRSRPVTEPAACSGTNEDVCIYELSSHTFTDLVMQEDKDVVVLFYAPWCGFCKNFAHTYLALAKYFKSSPDIVFTRINADVNDLMWEYTPESYPQITIFPAHSKYESVTLPEHIPRTLSNLVQFVLRHSAQTVRLESGLTTCSRSCIQSNLQSSAERVQALARDINSLTNQIVRLKERTEECQQLVEDLELIADDESTKESARIYKERGQTYRDYTYLLQRRLAKMIHQEKNARDLNKALRSTSGLHLEKHKLVSIIKRYEVFKSLHEDDDGSEEGMGENEPVPAPSQESASSHAHTEL